MLPSACRLRACGCSHACESIMLVWGLRYRCSTHNRAGAGVLQYADVLYTIGGAGKLPRSPLLLCGCNRPE